MLEDFLVPIVALAVYILMFVALGSHNGSVRAEFRTAGHILREAFRDLLPRW